MRWLAGRVSKGAAREALSDITNDLIVEQWPELERPVMILGLTGWMDGGHVSTGTVAYLRDRFADEPEDEDEPDWFVRIDPLDFYIYHFPIASMPMSIYLQDGEALVQQMNPMEFAAFFRPHAQIENGVITYLEYPDNLFWAARRPEGQRDLVLFSGEEPHIRWGAYIDCIFEVARELEIEEIYFVGSVASPIPHTMPPRLRASMADERLKAGLEDAGVLFGEYEGPASIITSLAYHSTALDIAMRSLVVEIPHYPFLEMPTYPRSILKVTSALNRLLDLDLDLADLQASAADADAKLNALVEDNEEFAELVARLEEAYEYEETPRDEDLLRRLIDSVDLDEGSERH